MKGLKEKVKNYFLAHPSAKLRVRQIEREAKVPLPSAIRYSEELKQEKILKSLKIGKTKLYSANRDSKQFLLAKKIYNIDSMHSSGFVDYLLKMCGDTCVVVFGNYASGKDSENSEIEVYVESDKVSLSLANYRDKLDRDIRVRFYKRLSNAGDKELLDAVINGVVLNGFLDIFK